MELKSFFESQSCTLSYLVYDENTDDAVIIDPVLNFDNNGWVTSTASIDEIDRFVQDKHLKVHYVMDTHIHADHLTGMQEAKRRWGASLVISQAIDVVQSTFKSLFNLTNFPEDGRQFDLLVNDGDRINAGSIKIDVLHTPGHTPACTTYKINDMIFTGDALFLPDVGAGRCDFPKGSAQDLYRSIHQKIYTLPDETHIHPGHDYQPNGRELKFQCTVVQSKANNVDLKAGMTESDFVAYMNARDSKLPFPQLLFQSVQVNMNAGMMPTTEENGVSYLKMPIKPAD